jgi:pimeloyl-ACP methyl ester carboxylesterase
VTARTTIRRAPIRRASVLVAALTAAALVLSGCSTWFTGTGAGTGAGPSTPTGEQVDPSLEKFYDQVIDWQPCDSGFYCATATAPLDWSNPSGDTVKLALIKKPATGGTRLGSLFVNPGGPGASAVDFVQQSADFAVHPEVQQSYDVIGFDPRGVGHSDAVHCLTDSQRDAYLYDIVPGDRGSQSWLDGQEASAKTFADGCQANTGPLLQFIDTQSTTHDLDMLRAAVGDTKLNYLGYSYGTFLGAEYAQNFPTHVGRMVLDGAEDPSSSSFDITESQAVGFESALKAYLTDCASRSGCWFTGTADQGLAEVQTMLAQVDKSPIRNSDGRELGSNTLLTAIFYPLYSKGNWPALDQLFASVEKGQTSVAFQLADAYNDRNANGTYADNLIEAFTAISCADYPTTTDPTVIAQQNQQLIAAAPTIGPYWTYGDIGCAAWPYPSTRTPAAVSAPGSGPILVVGTTNDPATPYKWAQALASQLDEGHLVTFHGEGHTAYNSSSCVADTVNAYFLQGTVPSADPDCTS